MASGAPRVSVVLPTYQRASLLPMTLESLLCQTLTEGYEVIVADDGSTDGTRESLAPYCRRIRYIRSEHVGLPRIINRALAEARGEYVMLCNDHDLYAPETLQALAAALDGCPSASWALSDVILVDAEAEQELATFTFPYGGPVDGLRFLEEQLLPGLGTVAPHNMWRADRLRGECLHESFGASSDAELWLRLSTRGDVVHVPERLVRVRDRDATSSLYLTNHAVVAGALRAKRAYLHCVADSRKRADIERSWRGLVDRSAMVALWRLLENQRPEETESVADIARQEGSRFGRVLIPVLAAMPAPLTLALLRLLRAANRPWSRR